MTGHRATRASPLPANSQAPRGRFGHGVVPRLALAALIVALGSHPALAQVGGGGVVQTTVPGRQQMTPLERAEYDSVMKARARADSAERDSSLKKLVNWVVPDSETDALMQREGYGLTRYQGQDANYNANTHALTLTGVAEGGPGGSQPAADDRRWRYNRLR